MSEFFTADEVAAMLKVKKQTVLKWHREGVIKATRIGPDTLRFTPESIEALKRQPQSTPEAV